MFKIAAVNLGASPATWTNNTGFNVQLVIGGGDVSAVALNGDNVPLGVWSQTTLILNPLDSVTVTYAAAPTVYYKPF
jgi:hypothetical protein